MPAYITVDFTPIDKDSLAHYGAAVPATLAMFEGKYLAKGPAEQLLGEATYPMQVILVFPSRDLASAWYHSPGYQALVPLRDAGMRSQFRLLGS